MEMNKTDTKDNLKNVAAYMIRHLSLIVICLSMALYIVLTVTSGANGKAIEYTTICIMGLLLSLTWFVMGEHRRILEKISEIQDEDNEIKCNCDEFNSKLMKIDDGLNSLTTMDNKLQTLETNVSKLLHKNPVSVEIIEDPDEFYKKLKDAESTATVRIWVTHLDPYPPTSRKLETSATNERTAYFNFLNDFAKAHPKVEVKRIIGISTIEKLEWLKEQMVLTKDIDNISFAYIRADCFGHGDSLSPLTVVSCQVIDDNKTFVLNPEGPVAKVL